MLIDDHFCVGLYYRSNQTGQESGSHAKGQDAGFVIRNFVFVILPLNFDHQNNLMFWPSEAFSPFLMCSGDRSTLLSICQFRVIASIIIVLWPAVP
uniref:Uncharacterized protein n=1 Tax=Rhizophora mucronata TaxID=61149 RepID=A0A2P2KCK6_RHIMU